MKMLHRAVTLLLTLGIVAWPQDAPLPTGRQPAPVMGIAGAPWLVRPEREAEEAPDLALDTIGVPKGSQVADIGCGSGYFTWRLARRVGPSGKVYAVDIQEGMLDLLRRNMAERKLLNYEPVLGSEDGPHLPPASIDLALLVDVYHEFSRPRAMLAHIRTALKPDGRMVLLEYRKEDPTLPIRPEHKMAVVEAQAEIEPEGFRLEKTLENLPRQHVLIFRRRVDSKIGRMSGAQRLE